MNDYNIKQLYEEMELQLISSMQRNLKRHLKEEKEVGFKFTQWQAEKLKELKRYQNENKEIIGNYTLNLDKRISKHLKRELKQGAISAISLHNRSNEKKVNMDKLLNKSFFKINDRKVNALIKSVNNDLKIANKGALRMINDQYRQIIHKSAFFVANGVMTETQAIDMANKDFLSRGLNCIEYKNGRRVNIASYAEMAIRTASVRAQLMGEGDFRKSIGRTLVQATSHGGACPICQKWENHIFIDDVYSGGTKKDGNYMLLSEAMEQGFLHPNCEHGLITYYPELEDIEAEYKGDEDNEKIQEKINYCDRNIKKYNRLEKGSIDEKNIEEYRQKKIAYEIMKEDIVTIKQELPYKDLTDQLNSMKGSSNSIERRLNYSIDSNGIKHYDFYFERDHDLIEEIECQKKIEEKTGYKVYLNPKTYTQNKRTPDYWIEDTSELWDLKGIDGDSEKVIDNILNKACKKKQTANLILKRRNTLLDSEEIKRQLKVIFDNNYKKYIKQVVLIDEHYNIIAYYKR